MPALASLAATLAVLLLVCLPTGGARIEPAAAAPAPAAAEAAAPGGPAAGSDRVVGPAQRPVLGSPLPGVPAPPSLEPVALLGPPSADGPLGIPALVLAAYQRAAATLAVEQPGCHLPWWLLAGIGQVESGQAEGGRVYPDGTTRGTILGPVLDGHVPGDAIIRDTDGGRLDGNAQFDRAVGPMQFIPSTWALWGADGNGDGRKDPNNIFDASLSAARYLCAGNRDLATTPGITAAIASYNPAPPYLESVLSWAYGYRDGVTPLPGSGLAVVTDISTSRTALSASPVATVHPAKTQPKRPGAATRTSTPAIAGTTSAATTSAATTSAATTSGASSAAGPTTTAPPSASASPSASATGPAPSAPTSTVGCSATASITPSASIGPSGGTDTSASPSPNASGDPSASADGAATASPTASAGSASSAGDPPVGCR